MLKFSPPNAKTMHLGKVFSLDLPAGWSCPGAKDCKSKVVQLGDKRTIRDGPDCQFRCFSASTEVQYTAVYNRRQQNFSLLKKARNKVRLIQSSLPSKAEIIRLHISGDFYSQSYFNAVCTVAAMSPDLRFYAYTKSLPFVQEYVRQNGAVDLSNGQLLGNFLITASRGGRYDHLIKELNIREALVIFDRGETSLPIDHDDSHAANPGPSFALLLHGTQPKDTPAAKAWQRIKKTEGGYSK